MKRVTAAKKLSVPKPAPGKVQIEGDLEAEEALVNAERRGEERSKGEDPAPV